MLIRNVLFSNVLYLSVLSMYAYPYPVCPIICLPPEVSRIWSNTDLLSRRSVRIPQTTALWYSHAATVSQKQQQADRSIYEKRDLRADRRFCN